MATNPIGGDASPVTLPGTIPPMPAVARILARYDRASLSAFIEIALELADTLDASSDPDTADFAPRSDRFPGDPADHESCGDNEPGAYAEWTTMTAGQRRAPACAVQSCGNEDDEDCDSDHGQDEGEPNFARHRSRYGPGCIISDSDYCNAGDDHGTW